MKHIDAETLVAWLEQRLSPDDAAATLAHLQECDLCFSRMADLQASLQHMAEATLPPTPPEIGERVRAHFGLESRISLPDETERISQRISLLNRFTHPGQASWGLAAAAVAFLLISVHVHFNSYDPLTPIKSGSPEIRQESAQIRHDSVVEEAGRSAKGSVAPTSQPVASEDENLPDVQTASKAPPKVTRGTDMAKEKSPARLGSPKKGVDDLAASREVQLEVFADTEVSERSPIASADRTLGRGAISTDAGPGERAATPKKISARAGSASVRSPESTFAFSGNSIQFTPGNSLPRFYRLLFSDGATIDEGPLPETPASISLDQFLLPDSFRFQIFQGAILELDTLLRKNNSAESP